MERALPLWLALEIMGLGQTHRGDAPPASSLQGHRTPAPHRAHDGVCLKLTNPRASRRAGPAALEWGPRGPGHTLQAGDSAPADPCSEQARS